MSNDQEAQQVLPDLQCIWQLNWTHLFFLMRQGVKKLWTVKPGSLTGHCLHMLSRFIRMHTCNPQNYQLQIRWDDQPGHIQPILFELENKVIGIFETDKSSLGTSQLGTISLLQKLSFPSFCVWRVKGYESQFSTLNLVNSEPRRWDMFRKCHWNSDLRRCGSFVIAPNAALGPDLQLIRQMFKMSQESQKALKPGIRWNPQLWSKQFEWELFL